MPFDRNGVWTQPVEADHAEFQSQLMSTKQEIAPTPEMIQAIAANLPTQNTTRPDVFNTIGKLKGPVDIVIPVYDGLHVLKPCIESIQKHTEWDYRLIIVDDASPDPEVGRYLQILKIRGAGITLITNKKNRGFAPTVNRGVAAGTNPYICILNSDTLVTQGWLVRQLMALEDDPRNAIVNPATNNTALVNVPMYRGCSYKDMADALAVAPNALTYNEIMPTGFCFTLRRDLWEDVGPFDEAYISYGEEALALDTRILTPKGWSTVGEINTGDEVYGTEGRPVKVVKTTDVFTDRPCFKVEFTNGEQIIADEGHNWTLESDNTVRTNQLKARDKIKIAMYLERPKQELLIDPYLFGAWIGDGSSYAARITTGDREIIDEFTSLGWGTTRYDDLNYGILSNDGSKGPIRGKGIYGSLPNPNSFQSRLKKLGVIANKHIPEDYLFSSALQRIALLQGLMDTDGYCSEQGRCVFSSSNTVLVDQVFQLISSLGMKPSVSKPIKNNYRITFRSFGFFDVFRLKRKQSNVKLPVRSNATHHTIKSIEPTVSTSVKCIGVDAEDNLFLVGESLIPTHNTDFWFKTLKMTDENGVILRNRGVIADNAYVFHERGTSFSQLDEGEHMGLRRSGSARFNKLHQDFPSWQQGFNADSAVNHLRNELPKEAFKKNYKGNIAWVVKSAGPCGGMNFIADIVNQLIEDGYNAKVCVVPDSYDEENPPELPVVGNLRTSPILFKTEEEFTSTFTQRVFTKGKVFAAVTERTPIVWDLDQTYKGIEGFNHVQSYDPELATLCGQHDLVEPFIESYKRLPNICSSRWVKHKLLALGAKVVGTVLPGVNTDLFHPRNRDNGDERFTVAILINEAYPFKGAEWAAAFIDELGPELHPDIRLLAIGPDAVLKRGVTCLGSLSQAKMANLLGSEVDVFIDPAEIHSYGMPALEALASGCQVITRKNKGIDEYPEVWQNRVTVLDGPGEAAAKVLSLKSAGPKSRKVRIDPTVNRKVTVKQFIDKVFPEVYTENHRIEVITPHLRKHGGPTTIIAAAKQLQALGHDVGMSTIYTDWNPEVLNMARNIDVRTSWSEIPDEVEFVFINSDNPFAAKTMELFPDKKYIMLKLSHNPRFIATENDNLNLPWAHIATSTEWLRQVCLNPLGQVSAKEKWDHKAWSETDVTTVGWYHYGHNVFNMPPSNRTYGSATAGFRAGTLIHGHPLKGSEEALKVFDALKKKHEARFQGVGFGEMRAKLAWYMQYFRSAGRLDMAHAFKQLDVWFGASHSEGLGRLALEAMSAGVAVVTTDTGAEFLKDGENCLLYPVGNAQAGAELVDRLVNDRELFTKIVVNGHATAEAAANPATLRANLNSVLHRVAEGEN